MVANEEILIEKYRLLATIIQCGFGFGQNGIKRM